MRKRILPIVLSLLIVSTSSSYCNPVIDIERIIALLSRSEAADKILIEGLTNYRSAHRLSELWGKLFSGVDDAGSLLKGLRDPYSHALLRRGIFSANGTSVKALSDPQARSRLRLLQQLLEENEAIRAFERFDNIGELVQGQLRLSEFAHLGMDTRPITDILSKANRVHLDILLNELKLEGGILRTPEASDDLIDFVAGIGRAETALRVTTDILRASTDKLSSAVRVIKDARVSTLGGAGPVSFNRAFLDWSPKMMNRWSDLERTGELLQEPVRILRRLAKSDNADEALAAFELWSRENIDVTGYLPEVVGALRTDAIADLSVIAKDAVAARRYGEAFEAVVLSRSLVSVSKFEKALKLLRLDMSSVPDMQKAIQEIEEVCSAQQRLLRRKIARLRFPHVEARWNDAPQIQQTLVSRSDLTNLDFLAETLMAYIKPNGALTSFPGREINITASVLEVSVQRATALIDEIIATGKQLGPQGEKKIAEILGERKALFETIADLL